MATLVYNSAIDSWVSWAAQEVAWSSATLTGALPPSYYSYKRRDTIGTALDTLHDNVTITDIKVEFTASHPGGYTNQGQIWATFAGLSFNQVMPDGTSRLYSINGGSGTAPSVLRAAVLDLWARNIDTIYTYQFTISQPIITVTYIDNGIPYMLQFSL